MKDHYLNGVRFEVSNTDVKIQVGDNWGNKIRCTIEEARRVWVAIKHGKIGVKTGCLSSFETIADIKDFLVK